MSPRRTLLLAGSVLLIALIALAGPLAASLAQTATPAAAAPAAVTATGPTAVQTSATPGTPTPTRTPAPTPTATATLTDLQSRLVLAQAYLDGKDYDRAADLFAEIATDDRGNATALEGLRKALDGRAAAQATLMAPPPTATPEPTEAPETLATSFGKNLREFAGAALAALLVIVALYFLAHFLRWLLGAMREIWYLRILPLLGRPAVPPGYLIGDFSSLPGTGYENAARLVPQALTEKLIAWNQLVSEKQIPVEPEPALQPGPAAWLSIFWRWLLPAPRGYRVSGLLLRGPAGTHQLSIQRAILATNSVDRSATFTSPAATPEEAFPVLAGEAAKWLIAPDDMESAAAPRAMREGGMLPAPSPSDVFDRALALLLPIRQQINNGQVDFPAARQRMTETETMLHELPSESALRLQLEDVLASLRKSIPS